MTTTAQANDESLDGLPRPSVADVLKDARKKIEKPENWCQGAFLRNGARCALAAIASASPSVEITASAQVALEKHMGGDITYFNYTHTHAEVLAAFDATIAEAQS